VALESGRYDQYLGPYLASLFLGGFFPCGEARWKLGQAGPLASDLRRRRVHLQGCDWRQECGSCISTCPFSWVAMCSRGSNAEPEPCGEKVRGLQRAISHERLLSMRGTVRWHRTRPTSRHDDKRHLAMQSLPGKNTSSA